jgi:hypothetical protein
MQDRVFLEFLRAIAAPIAAQVGRYGAEAGLRQSAELMAPGIPAFGEAVAKDDERTFALFGHVQADSVRVDHAMRDIRRRRLRPKRRLLPASAEFSGSRFERFRKSRADGKRASRAEDVASGQCRVSHVSSLLIVAHPRLDGAAGPRIAS